MMKTIETIITVLDDGSIQIPPRHDLTPGSHRAVLVVEEESAPALARHLPLRLRMLNLSGWPANSTYRREELYDDAGR